MTAPTSPFPPLDEQVGNRRRPLRTKLIAGGAAAALVLGSAATAVAMRPPDPSGYRTATVATRSVGETIDGTGTIEPVSQATVAFASSGTVATVDVAVGDEVTLGQTLATLDTTSLQATVTEAKADLAAAELTLHQALNGETITGGSGSGGGDGSGTRPASTDTASSDDLEVTYAVYAKGSASTATVATEAASAGPTEAEIDAAQQAVLDAKKQVDADMATAQKALDDANAACTTADSDTAESDDAQSTTSTTTTPASDGTAACQAALQQVLADQQAVADSQAALSEAADHLDALLAAAADALAEQPSTTTTTPSTGDAERESGSSSGASDSSSGSGGTAGGADGNDRTDAGNGNAAAPSTGSADGGTSGNGAPSGGDSGTEGSSPSAAQLIAYQADVDAAAATVAEAEQALRQADLVSPIAGTVAKVELAAGDDVSAGSSTANIVVVGRGGYEVSTTVTVDDLDDLQVGAEATVDPDGSDSTLTGKIVSIGVAPAGGSTTTYPVVIGFTAQPDGLSNGATASTSIVLTRAEKSLAVPTSAVRATNGRHVVTVLDDGEPSTEIVEIGAVGTTYTAITSGLSKGDEVVLADLAEPLPTAATEQGTNAGQGSGFRFGGGGGTGGPPSGGPPGS